MFKQMSACFLYVQKSLRPYEFLNLQAAHDKLYFSLAHISVHLRTAYLHVAFLERVSGHYLWGYTICTIVLPTHPHKPLI